MRAPEISECNPSELWTVTVGSVQALLQQRACVQKPIVVISPSLKHGQVEGVGVTEDEGSVQPMSRFYCVSFEGSSHGQMCFIFSEG